MVRPGAQIRTARELLAGRATHRVDGLPSNQHRHDRCFACTRGQLERQSHQFGIGVLVGCRQMIKQAFAVFGVWRNLQPARIAVSTASI